MRHLLLALFALLIPATLGAAPARDWSKMVVKAPDGAYLIGNPGARVKLVEYVSYTCPHCAHFTVDSQAVLKGQMVRSGSTRIELRHAIRDKIDLAAATVARCAGPRGFSALSDAIFAQQDTWFPRAMEYDQVNASRMELYPENARLRAYADGIGLLDIARAQGLSGAALDACFDDTADRAKVVAMAAAAWGRIKGTPSFEVNGKPFEGTLWAKLEPVLRAAGAK